MAAIAQKRQRHWIEHVIWALIYSGLLALTLGIATARLDAAQGWVLGLIGAIASAVGVGLIPVRARMKGLP